MSFSNEKVLILVKTYPVPSRKYNEVVCTAGITEDAEWVRLYPINFREMPKASRFRKFQWIQIGLAPRGQAEDHRKESRRPNADSIKLLGDPIPTSDGWVRRRELVDRLPRHTMQEYEHLYESQGISLGMVRPQEVLDVLVEEVSDEWPSNKKGIVDQLSLFAPDQSKLRKIPYKFSYLFRCSDRSEPYKRMIEDWEIGALYLNEEKRLRDRRRAAESVRAKYMDFFCGEFDAELFVGTTFPWNTWVVIGVFCPPVRHQQQLPLIQ